MIIPFYVRYGVYRTEDGGVICVVVEHWPNGEMKELRTYEQGTIGE